MSRSPLALSRVVSDGNVCVVPAVPVTEKSSVLAPAVGMVGKAMSASPVYVQLNS
jgi:hypothetical protein